jgi:branched-chain amino acid transport system ATP-binding protein
MLEIKNLNAGYGKFQVLFDVTTHLEKGSITAIVGPNGSGKSTLLKTIMGLTQVYSGKIFLEGKDITKLPTHLVSKLGISYLPQVGNTFQNLTIRENLMLACYMLNKDESKERIEEIICEFPMLRKYMNKKCLALSGGERQMLAMAMALTRKPKIILFDEPTASLAPKIADQVLTKVKDLREKYGISVILVEQAARKCLQIADEAILLVSGKLSYQGDAKEFLNNPELGKLYLGLKKNTNF